MPSPNGAERGESVTLINGITAVGKRTASIPFFFKFFFFFLPIYSSAGALRLSLINIWCYAPVAAACRAPLS